MTNIDPINPVSSSIAKHLAFALFGLGVFATIVMTLAQVYFDYQKEIALVEERFVNARISHGQSLSASVWNLSARQIEIELQGILNINGIEYAEVRALNGKTWSVGIKNSSDILVDESSLSFRSFGIVQPLGSLVLVAGKKSIYDRITIHAGKTLFFFGFWTFLLSSAVFMIFRQRVTRHLTKIVMYISSISIDTRAQLLVLDRPTNKSEMADELEQLVAGINTMRSQLEVSISNLKQNEERFRLLFENSEVAIWNEDYSEIYEALELLRNDGVIDLQTYLEHHDTVVFNLVSKVRVVQVNDATLKLFGAKSETDFLYKIDNTFGPNAIEVFKNQLYAIWDKKPKFRSEANFQTLDGIEIKTIISLQIPSNKTDFQSIPVSIIDITERKKLEEDLQTALVDAELANHAKSEFLATMSHELRTPLNAILGFSDILAEQYFGPPGAGKYREYAKDIHNSGKHLLELVNELLDISSIEAGKTSLAKENISINAIVDDCIHIISEKALSKDIEVEVAVANGLPSLYADGRALKQILLNLLTNAIKFTQDGGEVTVHATVREMVTSIVVTDNGPGIPSDKLSDVTNPFTKGTSDAHVTEQGWGLGLAISKSLIELHDGKMIIESEVDKGTSVIVEIPSCLSDNQ